MNFRWYLLIISRAELNNLPYVSRLNACGVAPLSLQSLQGFNGVYWYRWGLSLDVELKYSGQLYPCEAFVLLHKNGKSKTGKLKNRKFKSWSNSFQMSQWSTWGIRKRKTETHHLFKGAVWVAGAAQWWTGWTAIVKTFLIIYAYNKTNKWRLHVQA